MSSRALAAGDWQEKLSGLSRFVVTGGSGFLGRHLVERLQTTGAPLLQLSRSTGFDLGGEVPPLKSGDHVFHLAGRTGVPDSWKDPVGFIETNALGTARIAQACREAGCSLTVVSAYVYGVPRQLPIREEHPTAAVNPYALSKCMAEQVVQFYAEVLGCEATIVRLFNAYGPGQSEDFLIPKILRQVLDPAIVEIQVADLKPKRDYVYVADVVDALLGAVKAPRGSIFNVGSGASYSVGEIIAIAQKAAGTAKPFGATGVARRNEIPDVVADIGKLSRETGWRPRVPIEAGIAETLRSMDLR